MVTCKQNHYMRNLKNRVELHNDYSQLKRNFDTLFKRGRYSNRERKKEAYLSTHTLYETPKIQMNQLCGEIDNKTGDNNEFRRLVKTVGFKYNLSLYTHNLIDSKEWDKNCVASRLSTTICARHATEEKCPFMIKTKIIEGMHCVVQFVSEHSHPLD